MPDLTAVLIDDDRLIHATWTLAANCSNVKLDCYFSFDEFMKHDYPTNTPIFIDKNLKNASGIDVAERITQNLGFSSVYMASGDDLRKEELPSKVCGFVVNKEFPAELISKIKKQSVKFH
jgi:FixJ family two-component response regulator